MEYGIPIKTAEQRAKVRRKKAVHNSSVKHEVRKNRFRNSFTPITNGMDEDIPTSGEGWTLK